MFSPLKVIAALISSLLIACVAVPAHADWHRAETDHFVIYADADPAEIERFSANLERYHSALEHFTGRDIPTPSPSSRLTIYALQSAGDVRKLAGSSGVAGFYVPRSQGSVAFVQDIRTKDGALSRSAIVLLHEYAHHFLSMTDRFAMPLWMNEGAAEFFSNAYFHEDGSVYLGLPNRNRSLWIPDEAMSAPEVLALNWQQLNTRNTKSKSSFYGRSWLLYHYLSVADERNGQLREYWIEVLKGTPSIEAGQKAFGSLGVLDRQLDRHYRQTNWREHYHKVPADEMELSALAITPLSDAESQLMDTRIRMARGIDRETAIRLMNDALSISENSPSDLGSLAILGQAALKAESYDRAISVANQALSLQPGHVDALVLKGISQFHLAREISNPEEKAATYQQAKDTMAKLMEIEPDHTVPLVYSYRYYAEQSLPPSDMAKQALIRAAELAPFDQELWLIVGMMHMNDGRIEEARVALQPLASNPHGGTKAEEISGLLGFLADKTEGEIIPVQNAISTYFLEE